MFFKIGVLKNFAILEPLFNKAAGLLLQNTYGGCFQIFAATNPFFQQNIVFIADIRHDFCSRLLQQPLELFRKIRCSQKFGKFYSKTPALKAYNPIKNRLQHRCFPVEFMKFLRTSNLKSASLRATVSETCSFTWTAPFNNLHFWIKLAHMLQFLYHNLQFRLSILPSLLL